MIILMQAGCHPHRIDALHDDLDKRGLNARRIELTSAVSEGPPEARQSDQDQPKNHLRRTVFLVVEPVVDGAHEQLAQQPGVAQVVCPSTPYQLAHRDICSQGSAVSRNGLTLGNEPVAVVAGPCSVEGQQQILQTAKDVAAAGAVGLRGGAFKPRTSPYSFRGHGRVALEQLAEAGRRTGLAVVTEVLAAEQLDLVCRYADVLQIGARNMQNYSLLEAVGKTSRPVLLKRGPSATIDEFLLAAEYILSSGNPQVILCERGIRTFENHTRFTLPLASVPYLKQRTHLPVIVDPSHGTGDRSLVTPMSAAAIAAGADGLLLEVHPEPQASISDAAQTISCQQFAELITLCKIVAEAVGRSIAQPADPSGIDSATPVLLSGSTATGSSPRLSSPALSSPAVNLSPINASPAGGSSGCSATMGSPKPS